MGYIQDTSRLLTFKILFPSNYIPTKYKLLELKKISIFIISDLVIDFFMIVNISCLIYKYITLI